MKHIGFKHQKENKENSHSYDYWSYFWFFEWNKPLPITLFFVSLILSSPSGLYFVLLHNLTRLWCLYIVEEIRCSNYYVHYLLRNVLELKTNSLCSSFSPVKDTLDTCMEKYNLPNPIGIAKSKFGILCLTNKSKLHEKKQLNVSWQFNQFHLQINYLILKY